MQEKEYRSLVQQTFDRLDRAFENVDPDLVEYVLEQGAVTITFQNGTCCILSTQPSVHQIWLAAASKGIAFHFDYHPGNQKWLDDRGKGVELESFLSQLVYDVAGVEIHIPNE